MVDQERLWHETIRDDSVTETEARTGGNAVQELNPQMMHEIQVAISRLVSKAHQLIHNFTTNLAENWMHVRCKFDGGKVVKSEWIVEAPLLWGWFRTKFGEMLEPANMGTGNRILP